MTDREFMEKMFNKMESRFDAIETKIDGIITQQEEDHIILKALEHKSEINKSEHDNMFNTIAHMEGHLKNIDENIDAVKEIIGRHEVDITVLKRRPV